MLITRFIFYQFFQITTLSLKKILFLAIQQMIFCGWFNKNLSEETSSLSKAAINTLINSTILGDATVHDDLYHYRINKEFGDTKLTCYKHINCSLTNALEIVKAFKLKVGQSITEGNGVEIILLGRISFKKLRKLEYKIFTRSYIFFVTICIKKGKDSTSKYKKTFVKYFECSGDVFDNYHDCIQSDYLIDDMLSNIEKDWNPQISQDIFYFQKLHYLES